ncbi:histidine kinase [Mangrovibacter sp. SLW1]
MSVSRLSTKLRHFMVPLIMSLAVLGAAGMAICLWLSQEIATSKAGIKTTEMINTNTLKLLPLIPLTESNSRKLTEIQSTLFSSGLNAVAHHDNQKQQLEALQESWRTSLLPALLSAASPHAIAPQLEAFIEQVTALNRVFDIHAAKHIKQAIIIQKCLAVMLALLVVLIIMQWRISRRANIKRQQKRSVTKKHTSIIKNAALLQRINEVLYGEGPVCQRIPYVLSELQSFTPLQNLQLRVYEHDENQHYCEVSYTAQQETDCFNCPREINPEPVTGTPLCWRLHNRQHFYGVLLGELPSEIELTNEHVQLIESCAASITAALAVEQQQAQQQQFLLMQEKSDLAKNLHDSLAQSLSSMKMQVGVLQMQGNTLDNDAQTLVGQLRHELNSSWVQMRQLLSTFRLNLNEPGLKTALEDCCEDFSQRLGFTVALNWRGVSGHISEHQILHLVHIVREGLSNVVRHANATAASITVEENNGWVQLTLFDNGSGIPESMSDNSHYGILIMRDRAQSLNATFSLQSPSSGGTEITIHFRANNRHSPDSSE